MKKEITNLVASSQTGERKLALSRRKFLQHTGSFGFFMLAGSLLPKFVSADDFENSIPDLKITAWVELDKNGKITIYNPAAEMGQGSMTALAVIIAEELDANWADVHIENSPVIPEIYGLSWGGKLGGPMMTVGSRTIRGFYTALRQAGAQARYILLQNAAEKWNVPVTELSTEPSLVLHKKSNRKISYGALAANARIPANIPEIPETAMKRVEDFRLIGHVLPRFDVPAKLNGSAQFSLDVRVPGMLYGVVSRSPVNGATPKLLNENDVKKLPGVVDIVPLEYGIGLVATSFVQAMDAKRMMQIQWSEAKASNYDSDTDPVTFHALVTDAAPKGKAKLEEGNAANAMSSAQKIYDQEYFTSYLCHAQMEPLNAVVHVAADGQSVEAWAGTQTPDQEVADIAKALNINKDKINFHPCYLGGGFGRRHGEYCVEAALLSKQVKKPVKLIWTREDDVHYGMFRPASLHRIKVAVNSEGLLQAVQHFIAGPDERLQSGGSEMDYYNIPHHYVDLRLADPGIRTTYWRSVGHGANKFALESMMGEIAYDLKMDGYTFRKKNMQGLTRHLAILEKLKEMSQWGRPVAASRARGMAFSDYGGSYAAAVMEISVNKTNGRIRVHRVWLAADAGVVVQPDNAKAQMEGGVVMGISSVLGERISFKNGQVQQSNFYDYEILRMTDAPETIEVNFIPSALPPTSMGELSLPLVGGAIANAFQLLTGKTLRELPFSKDKVLKALAG